MARKQGLWKGVIGFVGQKKNMGAEYTEGNQP